MTKRIWVSNQPEGVGHDGTYAYLTKAFPIVLPEGAKIKIVGGLAYLQAPESKFEKALESVQKALEKVGHGDDWCDRELGPPRIEVLEE